MSAFDDEFGLFGEAADELERRPTLGARKIASSETVIDEIEPEDEQPARAARPQRPPKRVYDRKRRPNEPASDPWAGHRRASALLDFVARKLVASGEQVAVELFMDEHAQPVIELVVAPDDLGKVIGRSGRVAHALRTLVRATAEGRVSVDILDSEEAAQPMQEDDDARPR
ncbi:MAG: KH domain-containing protein [Candidatus Eremiobacteraeota bacterium]|nr:KH domain-containing protein [Candidatus Eremiobacteraeota bacterium]MBV8371790.1 KH domain-containing protein [Candidatus Eremiobacteraeota bacterium]